MMDSTRIKRTRFRAWHRGTREADYMIGGFFDRYHKDWDETALVWFETLLNYDDTDIMGWVLGTIPAPAEMEGDMLTIMRRLDYVELPR